MPDDPLNTGAPIVDRPVVIENRKGCRCEFCGCTLAPSGEIIRVGEDAKKFREHGEQLEKKDKELAELKTENSRLKTQLAEVSGSRREVGAGVRHK